MAASVYSIVFSNGQTLSIYQAASQGVNSNPVCTCQGIASANVVTTDFSLDSAAYVVDIIVPNTLTAGGIEFFDVWAGMRTNRGFNNLETFTASNTTRRPAPIALYGQRPYRLIQTIQGNA